MSTDVVARGVVSTAIRSFETGVELGQELRKMDAPPAAIIAYSTVCHDQSALLSGLRSAVGAEPLIMGCSTQGVLGRDTLVESGYAAGAMGLGGRGLSAASHAVEEIHDDPRSKGRTLGQGLLAGLGASPKAVVIVYDPLCAADMGALLAGLYDVVQCTVIGGAAGQTFGPMDATLPILRRSRVPAKRSRVGSQW